MVLRCVPYKQRRLASGPDLSKSNSLKYGQQIITSTLEAYGAPSGHSAMALTVGIPCGIATQLVLDGIISTPGILVPYTKEICNPIRGQLEKEGITMIERVL
jgi:saccharopine dehydrogenase-like NADP-dependent oxidoreductase